MPSRSETTVVMGCYHQCVSLRSGWYNFCRNTQLNVCMMQFNNVLFAFPLILMLGCSPSGDELVVDDAVVGDASVEVTFRGDTRSWDTDNMSFSINSRKEEGTDVYRWILRMQQGKSPQDHPGDVSLVFNSEQTIFSIDKPLHVELVSSNLFFGDLDCSKNPEGCLNVGYGMISGTQPTSPPSHAGLDDDIHGHEGTLVIDDIVITKRVGRMVHGYASGSFSFSGINTNASAPNPGSASGKFEYVPFEVLELVNVN